MNRQQILTALLEQKEELSIKLSKQWTSRKEETLVNLDSSLAQVVIGVRRSGKSILCTNILQKSDKTFAYINFDDERLMKLPSEDLNTVLECLYQIYGDFNYLFVDEIQNIDEWYVFVNRLLRIGMHILITGSNAKLLSGELASHLTGRHLETELFPFSFSEYCNYIGTNIQYDTTKSKGLMLRAFTDYLNNGGFPELINETRKQKYIANLVKCILTNDVVKRYSMKYKNAFEQMAHHLLNNAPSKINYKELQTTFGLKSDKTAENYVHYLKNTYLIVGLHKFSAKSKIRIRDEKAYSVDVALMNNRNLAFASENLGWRLETIIYIELLRRCSPLEQDIYYYEETAGECDFVVCQGSTVIQLIQVSYDISMHKTRKREIAGLLLASRKTGCDNLLLITNDEEGQEIHEDKTIQIEPAYQWLVQNG